MKDAITKELIHHHTFLNQYKYTESNGTDPAYLLALYFFSRIIRYCSFSQAVH